MLIVFQVLAAAAIIIASVFMLRGGGARHQAIWRILIVLFIVAAAASVFVPSLWTKVANLVGIARGTDLLLYLLVLTFLGTMATTYRKFRSNEQHLTDLARQLALLSAEPVRREADDALVKPEAKDDGVDPT